MGDSSSKPSPPPTYPTPICPTPPCPFTSTPWRTTPAWNDNFESSLREQIEKIQLEWKPTIVLFGPVGAGKSSFVNAILSVSKGHKTGTAFTAIGCTSCTTSYEKYTDKYLLKNFRLRDCMGIEACDQEGLNVADMVSVLKGHIKCGYTFNPRIPISPENKEYWRDNPKFELQTHCVVFVVDAIIMYRSIPVGFVRKIREIQDAVKVLHIPHVLILTKVDVLCKEVQKDIANIFRSVRVMEAVMTANETFNIPVASIHPVSNYEDDAGISWKKNIPLLLALRQITQYAKDKVDAVNEHTQSY